MAINDKEIEKQLEVINERLVKIEANTIDEKVLNSSTRDKIIDALNAAIDIPIFSEKTERKILDATIGTIYDVLREVIVGQNGKK